MGPFYQTPDFRQALQGYQNASRSGDITSGYENQMDQAYQNASNQNAANVWQARQAALRSSVPDYGSPEHQAMQVQQMGQRYSQPPQTQLAGYGADGNMLSRLTPMEDIWNQQRSEIAGRSPVNGTQDQIRAYNEEATLFNASRPTSGDTGMGMSPYDQDRQDRAQEVYNRQQAQTRGAFTGTEEAMMRDPAFQGMPIGHREAAFKAANRGNSMQDYFQAKDRNMDYGQYAKVPAQRKISDDFLKQFETQFGKSFGEVKGGKYDPQTEIYSFPDKVTMDSATGSERVVPGGSIKIPRATMDQGSFHFNNVMGGQNSQTFGQAASEQTRKAQLEKQVQDEAKAKEDRRLAAMPPPPVDTRTEGVRITDAIWNAPGKAMDAVSNMFTPEDEYNPILDGLASAMDPRSFDATAMEFARRAVNAVATGSRLSEKDPFAATPRWEVERMNANNDRVNREIAMEEGMRRKPKQNPVPPYTDNDPRYAHIRENIARERAARDRERGARMAAAR